MRIWRLLDTNKQTSKVINTLQGYPQRKRNRLDLNMRIWRLLDTNKQTSKVVNTLQGYPQRKRL